ncbi:hypothetical protein [Polynucleobacter sp. P1-05-14]|uniref:hypothetical protein n=1 Tax=Polynucleobacter sp. P1-05-14 TaxID=1819732 RepID=UPI001C0B4020|nr:hypothetical protein [Polynucleobacter sp. P1-05-14]MBU3548870.1 hypothetical protein [Polynucleobacter sp. P1-05-14]
MQIKKLLVAVVLSLGALMSVGVAQAQSTTNYDFSATFGDPDSFNNFGTLAGTAVVDSSNGWILSLTNLTENGKSVQLGQLFNQSGFSYIRTPGTGIDPITYNDGTGNFNINYTYTGVTGISLGQVIEVDLLTYNVASTLYSTTGPYFGKDGTVNVYTAGAPEIDGSLAPKVGFLLGCLFLMFGRKKFQAEPILSV